MLFVLLKTLIVAPWKLLACFIEGRNGRPWKRVLGDQIPRYWVNAFTYNQLQYLMGTPLGVYKSLAKNPIVDELGGDGRLLWITPKRTDRVILYCHGGAFLIPLQSECFPFWSHVKAKLAQRGIEVGVAIMSYSLVPTGVFPTPLSQASLAVEFLLKSGVEPCNLILTGDSAGGNLVLQILSHILHPHPSVEPLTLPAGTHLGPVYLMSPWVDLTGESAHSFDENTSKDLLQARTLRTFGRVVLADIPAESDTPYIQALKAPDGWFDGIEKLTPAGLLVSFGGDEILRDPGVVFFEKHVKPFHSHSRLIVQKGGVHDDPFFDFANGGVKEVGQVTPVIVDWIYDGLTLS